MKKTCYICDKSIGFMGIKPNLEGGNTICNGCWGKLDIPTFETATAIDGLQEIPLADIESAVSGDVDKLNAIHSHLGIDSKADKAQSKQNEKINKFMQKYQLEDLDEKDLIVLQRIAADFAGKGFHEVASLLGSQESREMLKVSHLSALAEQNWMIIRQLSRLNANIEKLVSK